MNLILTYIGRDVFFLFFFLGSLEVCSGSNLLFQGLNFFKV